MYRSIDMQANNYGTTNVNNTESTQSKLVFTLEQYNKNLDRLATIATQLEEKINKLELEYLLKDVELSSDPGPLRPEGFISRFQGANDTFKYLIDRFDNSINRLNTII